VACLIHAHTGKDKQARKVSRVLSIADRLPTFVPLKGGQRNTQFRGKLGMRLTLDRSTERDHSFPYFCVSWELKLFEQRLED
jgi:hypothetical protein